MKRLPALALCLLLAAPCALGAAPPGEDSSALNNAALDKMVKLELDTPLPQAMSTIAKTTGVHIEADPAVWDLLPWGEQTNINAKIENKTLREAIGAIAGKLGLSYVLKEEAVELQPSPALKRLGRRSTLAELQALDLLQSNKLELNNERPTVAQLLGAVDAKLKQLNANYSIEQRLGDAVPMDKAVSVPRSATISEALESLVKDTDATWYPWGENIVIVTKEDQVRNQLGKTVTARWNGVDIIQVLAELSQRCGVDFDIEPGAVQRIDPQFRNIKLHLDNASVRQALESIRGFTGLDYVVKPGGVYVWNHSPAAGAGAAQDPVIAMLQLDNGMQMLVRESQVPPDMREYLRHKLTQETGKIREMMKAEGFRPTTQPAEGSGQ